MRLPGAGWLCTRENGARAAPIATLGRGGSRQRTSRLEPLLSHHAGERHAAVLAEEFNGCTFLFAKVVRTLTLTLTTDPDHCP